MLLKFPLSCETTPKGLAAVKCNRRQCEVEHGRKEKSCQLRPKRFECLTKSEVCRTGQAMHLRQPLVTSSSPGPELLFAPFITWSTRFAQEGCKPATFLITRHSVWARIAGDISTCGLLYVVQNATLSRFPFYLCHLGLDPSCWRGTAARHCGTIGGKAITSRTIVQWKSPP